MPAVLQWVTYAIPLRYFLVVLRSTFLKGVGLAILWPQMLAMAVRWRNVDAILGSRCRVRPTRPARS